MTVLAAKRLSYSTPTGRRLQQGLNFRLEAGQLLLITGSNGCGKSTLLKVLLQQLQPELGAVNWEVSDSDIEYIPQLENTEVHLPLTLRDVLAMSHPGKLDEERVFRLGLLHPRHLDAAWNTASGGERKRTLLTRVLLRNPKVIVLDEPMNHLDHASRRAMVRVMGEFLSAEAPSLRGIVMVCHQGLAQEENKLFDILRLDLDTTALNGGAAQ